VRGCCYRPAGIGGLSSSVSAKREHHNLGRAAGFLTLYVRIDWYPMQALSPCQEAVEGGRAFVDSKATVPLPARVGIRLRVKLVGALVFSQLKKGELAPRGRVSQG